LQQFREWLQSGESLFQERSFLEVLSHHQGETLAGYPRPFSNVSTASLLCWPAIEGRSVAQLIEFGNPEGPLLAAIAVLEQFFSLSMIVADFDLDAMVVDANHRVHFRYLGNPIEVLPGVINTGMEYVTSVLAGNAALSAQKLVRLIIAQPPP